MRLTGLERSWHRLVYGLTRKVSLFVFTLLSLFIATFTTVNILAEQKVVEDRLKRRAQSVAAMLADFASNYLTDLRIDELRVIVQDIQRREDILYAYIVDSEGSLIVDGEVGDDNLFDQVDDALSREARASGAAILSLDASGLHLVEPVDLEYEKLGSVRLGMSIEQLRHDIAALRNRNLLLGAVFLIASLLISPPLVRRITRPLELLTASTEAASQGCFEQRIDIHTRDEIGTLAAAFNRMLGQLQQRDAHPPPGLFRQHHRAAQPRELQGAAEPSRPQGAAPRAARGGALPRPRPLQADQRFLRSRRR